MFSFYLAFTYLQSLTPMLIPLTRAGTGSKPDIGHGRKLQGVLSGNPAWRKRLRGSDGLRADPVKTGFMITARFFCESCKKETNFLPISTAIRTAAICRSTLYYWMEHGWIHWSELRSGHRMICRESLNRALTPVQKTKIGVETV